MFGIFKNLFGKSEAKPAAQAPEKAPAPAQQPAAAKAAPAAKPAAGGPQAVDPADALALPLKPVLAKLPQELQGKITKQPDAKQTFIVSVNKVMSQMPSGSVKITYAELRFAAPGFLADAPDLDQTPVEIPMVEIVPKLDTKHMRRRTDQKKVEVPDEVVGVFGNKGEPAGQAAKTQVIGTAPVEQAKPAAPAPAPAPKPAAAASAPAPKPATPAPAPAPAPEPSAPLAVSDALKQAMAASAASAKQTVPASTKPAPAPSPAPAPAPKPAQAPVPAAPKPTAPAPAAAPSAPGLINVTLGAVSGAWSDALKQEIAAQNLASATLEIPAEEVGKGLKTGKIQFTWSQVRAWLKPAPSQPAGVADTTTVDLPLPVLAPLYLAQYKPGAQKKVTVSEGIPDMFAGKGPAGTASAAVAAPTSKAAPVPVAINPNEAVKKAASLPGVAGALVASQEGLVVAAQLPAGINGDGVAGLIPGIVGRLAESAKDLGLGDVSVVSFVAGNVPWQVSKAGALYLATVGRAGESLPAAPIKSVAEELSRNQK